ncbi:uncharacterized protein K460DRAFT_390464 [Cucurbitaria berberidis CBS 394.84]|uniref:Cell division cycle protein 123 n=1 Tax=Cucurbitaria berberidis CBS 394.84 TaxID=1168544 RepID=A0A9P4GQA3_9PLEO|nr:uncharacterized protein K460DRAFT_390464 [Cucurbitaria berberidis CBS 394.84]KAF1849812.1 hypothetical protein K460DRAFT_390464 [Cucurbitaria berberidis CBS 394.84]
MQIRTIPFSLVAADAAAIKATQDSSHPSSRSQRFSTADHSREEILPIVPETPTFKHEPPPWKPYGYTLWHRLVARSQSMTDYHEVTIPSFLYEDLMTCHSAWVSSGRIHTSLLNEVIETWQSTKSGKKLMPLLDGTKKWFIRLDQMSPKDSPVSGKLPSSTMEDVLTKLCTSMRAYGCLQREEQDAKKEEREMVLKLVLNPWDEGMDPGREFRVFVPPPAARGEKINAELLAVSAISQYRWPYVFEAPWGWSLERIAELVQDGAQKVLDEIVVYTFTELDEEIRGLLLKHGFSFDIALQENGRVQLVEINPFGAQSGCGACLFNWVLDGKVLYGLEEAQFVITLKESA